jgi:hypothetical protein
MKSIPERDWKLLRRKRDDLLNRYCQRVNQSAQRQLADDNASAHTCYLRVYRHYRDADEILAACFDDWRRSTAWMRMLALLEHEILTVADLREFSDETRAVMATWRA